MKDYDKNGNILSLERMGCTGEQTYGIINQLSFTLQGNRLYSVNNSATDTPTDGCTLFRDSLTSVREYFYDANGNLTKDLNKGIDTIQYNCLNLPQQIRYTDGGIVNYGYGMDDVKQRIQYIYSDAENMVYCGNMIYEGDTQKYLLTGEGYVDLTDNSYHYYLKDHQGNNRVVIDSDGNVEEVNHFYPFGGLFSIENSAQSYKYNGKELDIVNHADWYDYGARYYDPSIARFTTMDPLAEEYYSTSPYTYCLNNPVKYVDIKGMFVNPIYDEYGNLLGTDDRGLQGTAIVMNEMNFKQGMSHKDVLKFNLGPDGLVDDNAKMNLQQSYNSLPSRPDYDGKLTLSEANDWYRNGNGQPLYVDASKIDLSPLTIEDLTLQKSKIINFLYPTYSNLETGLVYGNISVTLIDKAGIVRIGNVNNVIDEYDFESHIGGNRFRNFATQIGRRIAGEGIPFEIRGFGLGKISHRNERPFGSRKWFY